MFLNQRCTIILEKLMNSNSYVLINELVEELKVSRRSIYYDLEKIDGWLKNHGLPPVSRIRFTGISLHPKTKEAIPSLIKTINTQEYEYTVEERKAWIAICLLSQNRPYHIDDLMQMTNVSRTTTIEDLKKLKEDLLRYRLQLKYERKHGYQIAGQENNIRRAIVYFLSRFYTRNDWKGISSQIHLILNNQMINRQIEENGLQKIYKIITESEQLLGKQFTDDVLMSLSIRLLLFINRFVQGHIVSIDLVEKKVLQATREYVAARGIANQLESALAIHFPENETVYMTIHLLGAKVNTFDAEDEQGSALQTVVQQMVNDFETFACIQFQQKDRLVNNLLVHLKPAYYRIKYGIDVENPLAETIKTKYGDVFDITRRAAHHFEGFTGNPVSDGELAYIAMHFLGWINQGDRVTPRQKVLIVCPNGVGTSRILQKQLEDLFPNLEVSDVVSTRQYEEMELNVDVVLSTSTIRRRNKPVWIVNPILNESEKEMLYKKVNALFPARKNSWSAQALLEMIKKYATVHQEDKLLQELKEYISSPVKTIDLNQCSPSLNRLITDNRVVMEKEVANWQSAIRLAAAPLLHEGTITEHYVEAMIQQIEKRGPYILLAPQIAIPHARAEDGVNQLSMSLLKLEKSVSFSSKKEHEAKLFIVLANIDDHAHLKALAQLNRMLSQAEVRKKLVQTNRKEKILQLIDEYSLDENTGVRTCQD
ncbi:BglG family transcription antiterminator [Paenactinomyces guangxiensis]|uniref:BglG family transcription antiterminator n=1 Tax=Paenactinomyces guangxiensis TaxID=1490290 RepID=A0A7W2A7H0_9BACL|nr:BglG family transcription antiterminator [Paenactinomyces guangxiensis]MBA4493535.1 BglG family transcription antiterminator [Paenactinomyces guangxiensis]MBH8590626.1 BglG family transcription antiterminator [Paenactinomyces guangxiensis]